MTTPMAGGTAARPHRPRRLVLLLWIVVASGLLLEVVMQVGSYVVWRMNQKPRHELATGQDVVLCVGDSWTHGMGSSDPTRCSYPAVLQSLARSRTGRNWVVVNGGESGQNSRDVLQRLPSQLAEFGPKVVCVLVGQNDFWSVPDELVEGAESGAIDHDAYRFRWRIPRLVAWVYGKVVGFETLAGRADPRGPEWAPRTIAVVAPYANEPRTWRWDGAARAHQAEGWRLEAAKDLPGALRQFELALETSPDDPRTHQALAGLYRQSGRHGEVGPHLQWLAEAWARDAGYWAGRSLVVALDACGRNQEVVDVAGKFLARYPEDAGIWRYRAQCEFFVGQHEAAKRSIETAIRLAPDPSSYFLRYRICAVGLQKVDEGIASIFEGYVVCNDARRVADDLRIVTNGSKGPLLQKALDAFSCAPDQKARLSVIVDEVLASADGVGARRVLRAHLQKIALAVRGAGATPVFLTYPMPLPAAEVLRGAAQERGVKFLEVEPQFRQKLGSRRWADVRAPDGHCNDEGYRLMAEVVADGLQELLGR